MSGILDQLRGGDRRSVRGVAEVVRRVAEDPDLFGEVFAGITHEDPVVRMRCADAVEKITVDYPDYLEPFRNQLLRLAESARDKEVRWHMAQLIPRLRWNDGERQRAVAILDDYLSDESRIVKTFAMQALADLVVQDPRLRRFAVARIRALMETGSPAMKSRGRKLLARLERG